MINIVLYEPEIPQNTGNIMRTCAATKVHLHLIRPFGFVFSESKLKRSGVNYIPECEYTLYDDFEDFKSKNPGTYYYFTRYGKKPHSDFDFHDQNENIYLIFGKESTGIPKEILANDLEHCARIPMSDKVRALNVSNSVAVAVYEVLRQQNYRDLSFVEPFKSENYLEED